jgi:hypothetical protein
VSAAPRLEQTSLTNPADAADRLGALTGFDPLASEAAASSSRAGTPVPPT